MKSIHLLLPLLLIFTGFAYAQAAPGPVPVEAVQAEPLEGAPVVVELFSSQACVFCPKADGLLGDLIQNKNVIGLACHIDYFDVKEGSLAKPFCTARQKAYEQKIRSGPSYTPQVIVDGAYDVVGYRLEDVSKTISQAKKLAPASIGITALDEKDMYEVQMPALKNTSQAQVEILMIARPHEIKIAEGANKGKTVTYYNMIDRIQPMMEWDGKKRTLKIEVILARRHQGFVILAPDQSGRIMAAGQYKRG